MAFGVTLGGRGRGGEGLINLQCVKRLHHAWKERPCYCDKLVVIQVSAKILKI